MKDKVEEFQKGQDFEELILGSVAGFDSIEEEEIPDFKDALDESEKSIKQTIHKYLGNG